MRVVTYTPDDFPLLAKVVEAVPGAKSLAHRGFVDYYYASREWCRLLLALDPDGQVCAVMGLEQIPFEYEGAPVTLGCASNFATLRPGVGGSLFLHWVRSSELACVFGGSPDTHRLLQSQGWRYFHGLQIFRLNRPYVVRAGDSWWRAAVKRVGERIRPRVDVARRAASHADGVEVIEVPTVTDDMLPASSPFRLRMRPSAEYLSWRYSGTLPFVRYRSFRIVDRRVRGYVIVNEQPRAIVVAHADADDAEALGAGILAAVAHVAARRDAGGEVVLACAHHGMKALFSRAGFRTDRDERPFALGARGHRVEIDPDTSRWLINFDWIDNGLRSPFLDEDS